MLQSRIAIAFGWVPNIGKTVTSEENLRSNVNGRSHKVATSDKEYAFRCDGRRTIVSMDGRDVVEIEALDDSGLCVVYDMVSALESQDLHYSLSSMHGAVWTTFRELIDSGSNFCRCTAMDQLIQLSETCNDLKEECMCREIVKRFIRALENITDVDIYVEYDSHAKAVFELDQDSVVRANILYMERFVDIYEKHLGSELNDYKSQIRCRKEKVAMVRNYHSEKHRIDNANNIEALIVASNDLSKASKSLISEMASYSQDIKQSVQEMRSVMERVDHVVNNLGDYTKSIDDRAKDVVNYIESNKNMSVCMAVMTGITIVIALASFLYSMYS